MIHPYTTPEPPEIVYARGVAMIAERDVEIARLRARVETLREALRDLYDTGPGGMVHDEDDAPYQSARVAARSALADARAKEGA